MTTIEHLAILLLIAAVVAMAARRMKVPYTVGLVLAGIGLALLPFKPQIALTRDLIYFVILPPLVYEAALYIEWPALRRDMSLVTVLATAGLLLSAAVTATAMHVLVGWPWSSAALFSVLIAATDPVSVIATFKEAAVQGRLRLLVESESLFNDSTAAIAFAVVLSVAGGASFGLLSATGALATSAAGGVLSGLAVAGLVLLVAGRTDDKLVEITLTTVAAYGSFIVAERFHSSGVLAAMTAGLVTGNLGHIASFSDRGRESVEAFWEYLAFVINSLVFILIGIQLGRESFGGLLWPIAVAIAAALLGRAAAIYGGCALFARSTLRVSVGQQHVLVWGGLRGALALALALGLPADLPQRADIISVAFGVVVFSVLVQGTTIVPLLRRLGELPGKG
ncbi:MAG TPA: cation:proton antiporter [Anaerolineae bacterium]|nr:cation:proton antiporter [Anaerolineae bacterium]